MGQDGQESNPDTEDDGEAAFDENEMGKTFEAEEITLDSASGGRMVLNLFIEGEEPEEIADEGDENQPDANPQKAADRALFQSVIDGTVKTADGEGILSPQLAEDMEAAFYRNQGDPEMEALFEKAVNAYQDAMLAATADIK